MSWVYVSGERQKAALWAIEYLSAEPDLAVMQYCGLVASELRATLDTIRAGYVRYETHMLSVRIAATMALSDLCEAGTSPLVPPRVFGRLRQLGYHCDSFSVILDNRVLDEFGSLPESCFRYLLIQAGAVGSLSYTALTVGESAKRLHLSERQVRRMIGQGTLGAQRVREGNREVYVIDALSLSDNALRRGIGS